ncbi:MAG: tRNA preQ1(34) S-adenosylmethionine ribosyltransferase-isomerase QueA, partial [Deltaproteobacteria bacterium]
GSRLLERPRAGGPLAHRQFRELPALLAAGDLLVLNDAKVVKARLRGQKVDSGGQVEILLDRPLGGGRFLCLGQASKGFRPGQRLLLAGELHVTVATVRADGFLELEVQGDASPWEVAERQGELPLPPYLGRAPTPADDLRYQTVYAREPGAVAAPTAGLHFTDRILAELRDRGVAVERLTLKVGAGTFLPVRVPRVEDHRMHPERYEIPPSLQAAVTRTRAAGGRVIAVGTTALRALEAAWTGEGLRAGEGETDLFVTPGHTFRAIDGLLTNFHLPRSTLLVLVSALAGRERILAAYREAVLHRYRFFSYGDCMLIA